MRVPFLDLGLINRQRREELNSAFADCLNGGHYILGEQLKGFEKAFADYCGVPECVGVGSGLDALTLALKAMGVGAGDEVIVPGSTFIATWMAVSALGAIPVPVDVEPGSCLLDLDLVPAAITSRTKAIVPVHLYGQMVNMPRLAALAEAYGLAIVEDAAQAHGAEWEGKGPGHWGGAAAFSFYPGKNLGALGDGGAVVVREPSLARRLRRLRNYGSEVKYRHDEMGANSRLDELQAALLRVKLKHLNADNVVRLQVANTYLRVLSDIPELETPVFANETTPSWHLFVVKTEKRKELQAFLALRGVETLIHYPCPPHRQLAYASLNIADEQLPVTAALAERVLSLPIGPHLDLDQVDHVCRSVREFFGRH